MNNNEAVARIAINRLLEEAGWRFFDDQNGRANILPEYGVKFTKKTLGDFVDDKQKSSTGKTDYLLTDERGAPLAVIEAKKSAVHPLSAKEQAKKYAREQNCRFIILSNGTTHYLWDIEAGNPNEITVFPRLSDLQAHGKFQPNPKALKQEKITNNYIAQTQFANYENQAAWKNEAERGEFIEKEGLRFLRPYQIKAIEKLQQVAHKHNATRFLFEMATGTGKTLTCAAVIKLFLSTKNAKRALFLVDRIELEDQAEKAFNEYLSIDYDTAVYKKDRDAWRKADIVVTTVQSLLRHDRFKDFQPNDFDLVISDEAHRSINGNARAVFEYFTGYKLGLTATPKDYLKGFDETKTDDPREADRRALSDTYKIFGCKPDAPTFRYSLLDGVRDGFLINPFVIDARTEKTTKLLSEEGYAVVAPAGDEEEGESEEGVFVGRNFEKSFFSEDTNRVFCETVMNKALRDPVSGEIGKTLVFAVSQNHAAKLTQIFNQLAHERFPGKYQSDFALQVTSNVQDRQNFTKNFSNNNLSGNGNFIEEYKTSKTRLCITVGMMTTGYDCPDLLNIALMRPIFSPSDFVQMKGRGTRKHSFADKRYLIDKSLREKHAKTEKDKFILFDFFANCEYFEEKFNYDEMIKLPASPSSPLILTGEPPKEMKAYTSTCDDEIETLSEKQIGSDGMKIDRMFFQKFEETICADTEIKRQAEAGNWDAAEEYVREYILNKPNEFFTLEKLRSAEGADRRLSLREMLQKAFGMIAAFPTKAELLAEAFDGFLKYRYNPLTEKEIAAIPAIKRYFETYITDGKFRALIDEKRFVDLNTFPSFSITDFRAVPEAFRAEIPEYIKDNVQLSRFES